MRRPLLALLLVGLLGAALLASACGTGEERDVKEGEAIELGELRYNVQLTRFLNDSDPEDKAYLAGLPPPAKGKGYLAVFMTIQNEGDVKADVPSTFTISDTRDNKYTPTPVHNPYALKLGASLAPDDELPTPDTPPANGPIKGAMVLFTVDDGITENRPVDLTIPSPSGDASVELDI